MNYFIENNLYREFDTDLILFESSIDHIYLSTVLESRLDTRITSQIKSISHSISQLIMSIIKRIWDFVSSILKAASHRKHKEEISAKVDEAELGIRVANENGIDIENEDIYIADIDEKISVYEEYMNEYMALIEEICERDFNNVSEMNAYADKKLEDLMQRYEDQMTRAEKKSMRVSIKESMKIIDESLRDMDGTINKIKNFSTRKLEDLKKFIIHNMETEDNVAIRFDDEESDHALVAKTKAQLASLASTKVAKLTTGLIKFTYNHPLLIAYENIWTISEILVFIGLLATGASLPTLAVVGAGAAGAPATRIFFKYKDKYKEWQQRRKAKKRGE